MKANAKGYSPYLKEFQVKEFDGHNWPAGSVPLPVCSRFYFQKYWEIKYKYLKLQQPSHDTSNECSTFANLFTDLNRQSNKIAQEERAKNDWLGMFF